MGEPTGTVCQQHVVVGQCYTQVRISSSERQVFIKLVRLDRLCIHAIIAMARLCRLCVSKFDFFFVIHCHSSTLPPAAPCPVPNSSGIKIDFAQDKIEKRGRTTWTTAVAHLHHPHKQKQYNLALISLCERVPQRHKQTPRTLAYPTFSHFHFFSTLISLLLDSHLFLTSHLQLLLPHPCTTFLLSSPLPFPTASCVCSVSYFNCQTHQAQLSTFGSHDSKIKKKKIRRVPGLQSISPRKPLF